MPTLPGPTYNNASAPPPDDLPTAEAPAPVRAPREQEFHPFIEGLLQSLPKPESNWATEEQAKWLQTASGIFGLIYKGTGGEIKITVQGTAAGQPSEQSE